MNGCTFDGCEKRADARGLCYAHYARLQRRGTLPPLQPRRLPEVDRFWSRVEVVPACCWTWLAGANHQGYGYFKPDDGQMQVAHRYAWELLVGPVPDGLQLDHLCRNPRCVNPDHMEPVTGAENLRRGYSVTALNARKVVCIRGHNDWRERKSGGRTCGTCDSERRAGRYAETGQ